MRFAAATALIAALLFAGCTETGSLPTGPPPAPPTADTWTRLYPDLPLSTLTAAWGMDIDDMWIVGFDGVIMHWDGQSLTWHDSPTGEVLTDIEGCARDDIWAVAEQDQALHWDGRRWSLEELGRFDVLASVHCAGPEEVYLGGRDHDEIALILQRDGTRWRTMPMAEPLDEYVHAIWRPGPDRPLMAATRDQLLRWDGNVWQLVDQYARVHDADGDLVFAELTIGSSWRSLCRVAPDGHLVEICSGSYVAAGRDVADTEPIVANFGTDVAWLDGCIPREFIDGTWRVINDLATPVHGGPSILAVGHGPLVNVITWHDGAMTTEDLIPLNLDVPGNSLAGDADHLYAAGVGAILLSYEAGRFVPVITPIDGYVYRVQDLGDRKLAVWGGPRIAWRDANDYWTELPEMPVPVPFLWIDGAIEPRGMTSDGHLYGLVDGAWSRIGEVDLSQAWFGISGFAGLTPDELYVTFYEFESSGTVHRFLAWNGTDWQDCDLAPGHEMIDVIAGPLTGSLYFRSRDLADEIVCGVIRDGAATVYTTPTVFLDEIVEVTENLVFARDDDVVYQLGDDGWVPLASPDAGWYRSLWGHPEQGLYLLANNSNLHHRPLPEGRP